MIHELDQTLKRILKDGNAPEVVRKADVSFLVPDQTFSVTKEIINLYLYDTHENRTLRNPVPIIESTDVSFIRRMPPLRVDCSYMVTAWSNQTDDIKADHEHQLLSLSMLWLSRFPLIPDKFFPNDWRDKTKDSYQPFPPPMWVAQVNGVKEPGEFWAALNQSPRPFFNLVVTIAMDLRTLFVEGPLVTTKATTFGQSEGAKEELVPGSEEILIQIGGRVFDSAQPRRGIADALVSLVELRQTEKTDEQGKFSFPGRTGGTAFPGLTSGNYTLRVSAAGYARKEKTISVPGPSEEYEVGLTPG
jgi:hypothetical protein